MLDDSQLFALSPLDGRYQSDTAPLRRYFSEFAYIKNRIFVEIRYLLALSRWKVIKPVSRKDVARFLQKFSPDDARHVKDLEKVTKHDVKAIEYFLKEKIKRKDLLPYVHFGLTSEDVNNLAYGISLTGANETVIIPILHSLLSEIKKISRVHMKSFMIARTHGQPAVATTFGKEFAVYVARLDKLERRLKRFHFEGKLNGAVGNYNAHAFAFPKVNWLRFSREFVSSLGLTPNLVTTQILPADNFVEYGLLLLQINSVLIGLCQDMWMYISRGIVRARAGGGQVGSSTMPQKINPIDFENAEGNLQIANSYFEFFARKLPVSRMQRDLSDSTVKRTIGSSLAHTVLAWKSIGKGLEKISFDTAFAARELQGHWEILAEAMQIYFKVHGDPSGYEKVKSLMMGKQIDKEAYAGLTRGVPPLAKLRPETYSGLVLKVIKLALKKS